MIQMVEKGIRGGVCHAIYWYPKASNKYMRDYKKIVGCKQFIGMVNVSKMYPQTILNEKNTHQSMMSIL